MKKNVCFFREMYPRIQKLLSVMKLTIFLLLISVISVFASKTYSQTKELNLNMENSTIKEVLKSIENQSEFYFMYSERLVDVTREVSVNIKNKKVEEVLDELFAGTNVSYKVKDRFILLTTPEVANDGPAIPQEKTISGKVTDSDGFPLPGVTVVVKGTAHGTVTNADGGYFIANVAPGGILQFSFVGMRIQEVIVGDQSVIDVVMVVDAVGIEEVVAVGYGVQKKVNLTGAVQTLNLDEVVNKPVSNSSQLMYGKFSGVNITQNSGLPGSDGSTIVIRGTGTFGSSVPLVIIDGMQFEGLREFNRLNASDIENITVLKDASAVAIYGARGANGVILVKTRTGTGGKFKIEYNNYFGIQEATVVPEYCDAYEYATLMNEALVGWAGGKESAARYTAEDLEQIKNGSNPDQFANTDWVDVLLQSAPIQNHHLAVSGGDNKTQYRLGVGYLSQGAIIVGKFDYDRLSFNLNLSSSPKKWVKFNNTLLGSYVVNSGPSNADGRAGLVMQKMALAPTIPVQYSNGYYGVSDGTFRRKINLPNQNNPLEEGLNGSSTSKSLNLNDRLSLMFTLPFNLSIESAISINLNYTDASDFFPGRKTYWWDGSVVSNNETNRLNNSFNKEIQWIWENIARWNLVLEDKHDLNFLLGYSASYHDMDNFNGSLEGFPTTNLFEFNAGGTLNPNVGGNRVEYSLISLFGRLNYNYKQKYLFEANLRRDGSSKFGPKNRFANFPSFSIGWLLSEEGFIKNTSAFDFLSYMKVRTSWGRTGNNRIGNYIWDQTYNTGIDYILGSGSLVSGVAITSLANTQIRWETTDQYNIGLDLGVFDNKLNLVADYFSRSSYDILYSNFPVPSTLGVSSLAAKNSAETLNTGLEFNLNYQKRGDFSYSLGINFTKMLTQEVIDLGGGVETISGVTIITEGEPYMAYYGYKWLGIFQSEEEASAAIPQFGSKNIHAGDVQYADVSGPDGKPDGQVDAYDRVIIGNPHPEWIYGANASFEYKGFDLDIAVQGIKNVDRFIQADPTYGFETRQWNAYRYWLNRWTPENPSETLHRIGASNRLNNIRPSAQFIEDGSYLRVKSVELGYSVPQKYIKKIGMERIRVFVSGQNLLTLSKMNKNIDPERFIGNFSVSNVPPCKIYSVGCNVAF